MWISNEKKYVEKSLRTKKKTDAIDLAEELYIQLRNKLANGKTLFVPTYAEAIQQYISYKQREVDVNALTDSRLTTIKAHLSNFVEYNDKNVKVSNVGINKLVQYEHKGKDNNYVLFRKKRHCTTNNNVRASSFSAKDISDMRNDFVQKQQALQSIKPIFPF